jgi:cytochrome b561
MSNQSRVDINISNTPVKVKKWPAISRVFHWVSAVLLLSTWFLMFLYQNLDNGIYISLHKAFGVSLLFWMIARVINRLFVKAPPPMPMPKWQTLASKVSHLSLYALLIAMPVAGLLMSIYGGRPVDMFGLFEIPVFLTPDRTLARFFNNIHTEIIWTLILAFTALHISAALYHQFVKKDNLIARMK